MVRFHPIKHIDDIWETPPHAERLEELRRSSEVQHVLAGLNTDLVQTAPSEGLANGGANGAENAMCAALEQMQQAASEVQGVMETRGSDSNEADEAYRALEDIVRSTFGAREGFKRAQDAWWSQNG